MLKILRTVALLFLCIVCYWALGIFFATGHGSFSSRTAKSSENVVLHDGRLITVEREVDWTTHIILIDPFFGLPTLPHLSKSWPDKFWLKFKHPGTQKTIKWQGEQHYTPVLIDIVDGVPYLVVLGRVSKETEAIYGCPELPYSYLKYESGFFGKWVPVPVEKAPDVLRESNLSLASRNDGGFFQKEIPRTYEDWNYQYKNEHLNERKVGDCRPPRAPLPQLTLPAATERAPEIIKTIDYTPERVSFGDDWGRLTYDQKRERECKILFRPADPNGRMQDQRFINDSTGEKRVPYSRNGQFQMGTRVLCDEYVWFVTHQEEPGKIVITRFTITGDLADRISFPQPESILGFVGYISIPSLRSEDGYLYFDWMNFRDINREWHIKRVLKMRIRESNIVSTSDKKKIVPAVAISNEIPDTSKLELEKLGGGNCGKGSPKVSAEIYYRRGKALVALNRYKPAMVCLMRAQEVESDTVVYRDSCFQIATMYELGWGVEKNIETAKVWLKKAGL